MVVKSHFDDCPYYCNVNGQILDSSTGNMIDCPHCSKIKKELLAKGKAVVEDTNKEVPLNEILGIKSKYLSKNYVFDAVIPEGEKVFLEDDSIEMVKQISEEVYHKLILGELLDCSYCFGLSIKGNVDKIIYPYLAVSYLAGLKIGKAITCSEFARLQLKSDDTVDDLYKADIVVMLICDGSTKGEIASAKGLMQTRALKGKPTIFVTTWTIEACSMLLGYSTENSLLLAKPVFVKYKNSGKASNYINQLTGVENSRYDSETDTGGRGYSLKDL